jgi:hypothetical protein
MPKYQNFCCHIIKVLNAKIHQNMLHNNPCWYLGHDQRIKIIKDSLHSVDINPQITINTYINPYSYCQYTWKDENITLN